MHKDNQNKKHTKDFDAWNEKKKGVNSKKYNPKLFFNEREVWWASVGVNVGVETDGKHKNFERPVLIITVFNGHMFWGVPLTSAEKQGEYYVKITHNKGESWANITQLKSFSSKRLLRKIGMIPKKDFDAVINKATQYIQIDPRKSRGLGGRSH